MLLEHLMLQNSSIILSSQWETLNFIRIFLSKNNTKLSAKQIGVLNEHTNKSTAENTMHKVKKLSTAKILNIIFITYTTMYKQIYPFFGVIKQ